MIDCREAVRRMWAYLDLELDTTPLAEFEHHLETCRRCCGELEFSRHLREMVAAKDAVPGMPQELRSRIEYLLDDPEPSPEASA
jgi:mycothiol system anti-sigma-R factor